MFLMYAYDTSLSEPICSKLFDKNMQDLEKAKSFVKFNKINNAILFLDKDYSVKEFKNTFKDNPFIHFIMPLKNNDIRIRNYNMLERQEAFYFNKEALYGKKVKIKDNRFLYSYQNLQMKIDEEHNIHKQCHLAKNEDDFSKIYNKNKYCGFNIFESDLDLPLEQVYSIYRDRYKLEMVFKIYKNSTLLNTNKSPYDFSIVGLEFINLIATMITCRLVKKAEDTGILDKITFGELIDSIRHTLRSSNTPLDILADVNDEYWDMEFEKDNDYLYKLGLVTDKIQEMYIPKKVGRKRIHEEFVGPKRKKGRPRIKD